MISYNYKVEGKAAHGQTWTCEGRVDLKQEGDFQLAVEMAMQGMFQQLTLGKAVYGKPGVGCRGPYTITSFLLERIEDEARS